MPLDQNKDNLRSNSVLSFGSSKRDTFEIVKGIQNQTEHMVTVEKRSRLSSANEVKCLQKVFLDAGDPNQPAKCSSTVFKGKQFHFSCSFPDERVCFILFFELYLDSRLLCCHNHVRRAIICSRVIKQRQELKRACFRQNN